MTPEKEAAIRAKYPHVFSGPLLNDEPFRCDDGWADIIDRLCAKLEPIIAAMPDPEDRQAHRCAQVKEKFGGLRFYTFSLLDCEMTDAIGEAERESLGTCEVCGQPGSQQKIGPWLLKTVCATHYVSETKRYERR